MDRSYHPDAPDWFFRNTALIIVASADMHTTINGFEMHWDESGEGEPLLWLHGGTGAGSDWHYVFPESPAGYRVIKPDLRGHGASSNPAGEFSFRQCARDVLALLDHLELTRVKAIGLSGGGITLLHMAVAAPERITTMVVISAPPYFPDQARAIMRQYSPAALSAAEMQQMRTRHTRGPAQIDELFAIMRGLADSYDDVNFTNDELSRIQAETLIVFGDRDPLYAVELALYLYRGIQHAALWVVPRGGHGPIFGEVGPQFRDTALKFLLGS
jgi:pimeloyl-ACP methyl ester carboxylesterase